jgi:AraC-like DNA-binding protein/quercetin dioxygenase-like cupin family protein
MLERVAGAIYQSFPMPAQARAQAWSYTPQFRRPRHFHAEPELNLVLAGRATFGVGDAVVEAHAGELLGFAPGQDHELLDASPDLVLFAIGLKSAFSSEVLRDGNRVDDAPTGSFRVRLPRADLDALTRRTASVVERAGLEQPIAELWQAAHRARRGSAITARSAPRALTRRALSNLTRHPELGRAELARLTSACPSELSRNFHRDLGVTLLEYRTRLRLLRLIQRVDAGATNLVAAALDVGFGSYSQFHRAFRATFDCSPRRFFNTDARQRMEDAFAPSIAVS